MAPRVSAGFTRRPVATSNVAWSRAREGARMERAIWARTAALATRPHPLAPPLRVAERGKGGEVSPAHASAAGAHRGRAGHDVRGSDRAIRDGAGGGDCVLATGARPAGDGSLGLGRSRGEVRFGERPADGAPEGTSPFSPLPAPHGSLRATARAPFLVLDRVAPVHDGRELGGAGVAQAG